MLVVCGENGGGGGTRSMRIAGAGGGKVNGREWWCGAEKVKCGNGKGEWKDRKGGGWEDGREMGHTAIYPLDPQARRTDPGPRLFAPARRSFS